MFSEKKYYSIPVLIKSRTTKIIVVALNFIPGMSIVLLEKLNIPLTFSQKAMIMVITGVAFTLTPLTGAVRRNVLHLSDKGKLKYQAIEPKGLYGHLIYIQNVGLEWFMIIVGPIIILYALTVIFLG